MDTLDASGTSYRPESFGIGDNAKIPAGASGWDMIGV